MVYGPQPDTIKYMKSELRRIRDNCTSINKELEYTHPASSYINEKCNSMISEINNIKRLL